MTHNHLEIHTLKGFIGEERNLFLINYPLQLINAIEAQKHFKTQNNVLVIFYYAGQESNYNQLVKLIGLFEYSKLIFYKKNRMSFMTDLINEIQKESYSKVFTGFFSLNSRRIIANIMYSDLYLIDDGVYSISIHNQLYGLNKEGYKNYITTYLEHEHTSFVKQISFYFYFHYRKNYLKLFGYKNDMDSINLKFYTIFDLPRYRHEVIIKNNFDFFKSYYSGKHKLSSQHETRIPSDAIFFLGQPLYNSLTISYTEYLYFLQAIFSFYKQNIIYIPHRGENENTFEDIKNLYPQFIEVRKLSQPFELYLLENNILINHLVSFVSSALFTVKKLYPNVTIEAFKLPIKGKLEKNVLLIYNMLEKNGANILEVNKDGTITRRVLYQE